MTPFLLQGLLLVAGLVLLYFGAEWMVRGASRLAHAAGISALVIGLTVVAFGTSAPELMVSGVAAARGQAEVALGNVVGSNIMNLAVIMGIAALICPLRVQRRVMIRETPIMFAATLTLPALAWDGRIGRLDAGLLLVAFAAYILYTLWLARQEAAETEAGFRDFEIKAGILEKEPHRLRNVGLVVGGIGGLVLGAQLLVDSAVFFARAMGVSDLVIGLTIVALGTSLPELATSIVAAFRGEADIAIGNVIGSNIFNSLAILGVAASLRPIAVPSGTLAFEVPVMIGITLLFLLLAYTGLRLERWEGALLLGGYTAFTCVLLLRNGIIGG